MDTSNLKIKDIVYNLVTKWGKIKGNITEQTDLQIALNSKQNNINSTSKLSSDLVNDTNNTNKFVTTAEKTAWNNKEDTTNKVTSISSSSTNNEYPSAKCVYDLVGDIENILTTLTTGGGVS